MAPCEGDMGVPEGCNGGVLGPSSCKDSSLPALGDLLDGLSTAAAFEGCGRSGVVDGLEAI